MLVAPSGVSHISWARPLLIIMIQKREMIPFFRSWKKSHPTNFFEAWDDIIYLIQVLKIFLIFVPITEPSFLLRTTLISETVLPLTLLGRRALFPQKSKQGNKNKVTQRIRKYVFLENKRSFHSMSKTELWTFLNVNTVHMAKGISSMSIKGLAQ